MIRDWDTIYDWFLVNYGHLDFKLSPLFREEDSQKFYFHILHKQNNTNIGKINFEKVLELTLNDLELRKLLFDALLKSNGHRLDNNFKPIKEIKKFKL
jgi:hypothetical protein